MQINGYHISSQADLRWADLSGANLSRANLSGADLSGADLRWAYLSGALWKTGKQIDKAALHVWGLYWPVLILDEYMQIGCQVHSVREWETFSEGEIIQMDGKNALRFWRNHKQMLMSLCKNGQQVYEN